MERLEILVTLVLLALVEGLLASFLILLAGKWNLLEKYDMYRAKWMPIRCEFCATFWFSLILTIGYMLAGEWNWFLLLAPAMAASINFATLKGV